ncbi:MAG: hypothetical protein IT426_16840 [Pirellulales bacterium]|nr:hypothetical protein [Pirellulales bacterium]
MKTPKTIEVFGQPSWTLESGTVTAFITQTGGQLAPVGFRLGRKTVQPFSIAPWWNEKVEKGLPPIVRVLRGDFFCLPFGGNDVPYRGVKHEVHGDTANLRWKPVGFTKTAAETTLRLGMELKAYSGHVEKRVTLVPGQTAVYQKHIVTGVNAPTSLGHHAILKFPEKAGSGRLSTSKRMLGQVFVEPTENPENRGYSILKPGATFDDLAAVPTVTGATTDLGRYPARRGFEDIAILVADPTLAVAWTAVAFPEEGYAWFALRDPKVLASTLLWISNGGRHYPPWSGRHVNALGVEDITGCFHYGAAQSAKSNVLAKQGVRTSVTPTAKRPLHVNYIMGLTAIPKTFDCVKDIVVESGKVILISERGASVGTPVNVEFLQSAD